VRQQILDASQKRIGIPLAASFQREDSSGDTAEAVLYRTAQGAQQVFQEGNEGQAYTRIPFFLKPQKRSGDGQGYKAQLLDASYDQ
jgi:hypothetical protein